jgi:fucose permease
MYSLLLAIIYMAFIGLGLPDSLLGSGWPAMQVQMEVPLSYAGIISAIIAGSTIVSSLYSDRMTRKLGAGLVTAVSTLVTAAALFGFSLSGSFPALCLCAVPYGLGAGAVDAALNNYVALRYASRHMNWLHCFWGVGAAASPYVMGYCLSGGFGWNGGYGAVAVIQAVLAAGLFCALPVWKRQKNLPGAPRIHAEPLRLTQILSIRGVKYILSAFFCYCALESTAGLWASSYLVTARGVGTETAAEFASLFYLGITFGRFLCGFAANRAGDRSMIRIGIAVILAGIAAVLLPLESNALRLCGLAAAGLGCAPVYPSIIHATPDNFGPENSQAVIGVQMASAYAGSTLMPPLFGLLAGSVGVSLYPVFLLALAVFTLVMTEALNRSARQR